MALFFDTDWFDARLQEFGLKQADISAALGLTPEQVNDLWKDQRELRISDVRALSKLLHVSAAEIATRAGVSTPVPAFESDEALAKMNERLDRLERTLAEIKALVLDLRTRPP
jgi:transcriptional regulator with XRE-family HTH domain